MKYRYYITDPVKKEWDKKKLGPVFQQKLAEYLKSNTPVKKSEEIINGVQITRIQGVSGRPTFAWMSKTKGDALVYVLRAAYSHDEYETAMMGTSKLKAWALKNALSEDEEMEVELVLDSMLEEKTPEIEIKPLISGEERDFISGQLDINQDLFKDAVYETKAWVDYVQSKGSAQFDFFAIANKIENHIVDNLNTPDGWQQILFNESVIFIYHKGENWVLDNMYEIEADDVDFNLLMQCPEPTDFRRGYPFSYLYNKDDWQRMELDKKSNMVLSKDQVAIISEKTEYPLFITGRAGSGKSTMLQYLFAEIILRYISHKTTGAESLLPPVYLSYSENLIQDAKSISQMLLEKNSCYRKSTESLGIHFEKHIKPEFDGMFYVFQTLVKNCIRKYEADFLAKHFANSQYVSFANFNSKWNLKFGNSREANKKYGSSLCWHVIRTYIKGWDSRKLMTPADYALLPKDRKTVSDETFTLVYEKVWDNWYSKLNNVWDDQDLVRYCLDKGYAEEKFSGVFCDEAQDFTRVELDFILKLSCFSNRTIEDVNDIKKLPFVFAGDEFQTLNPTGFSWDSLRSYFAERLGESTGLASENNAIRLAGEVELSENFRSTRQVVKLANHIQLLRATRFSSTSSKPQSPHFSQEGSPIVCLSPSDSTVFDRLRNKEIVLIVPAADGVSACEYIANSPLRDMIKIEDGVPQGLTILNPTQAKGLEFPNVAVYGFDCSGGFANLNIKSLIKWYEDPVNNEEADIELKYQLSNAYVAVTRASNKLFIIDDFDITSFWAFAYAHPEYNNSLITPLKDSMLGALSAQKRKQWPESLLGWITPGTVDDITNENVDYMKSEENRTALEKRAEALRDSELMRQAACRNKEAGLKKDEDRCWAKACSFDEQFLKAAEFFVSAAMIPEAVDNYWLAMNKILIDESTDNNNCIAIIGQISGLRDKLKNLKVNICFDYRQKSIQTRELKLILDDLSVLLQSEDNDDEPIVWNYLLNGILPKVIATKKVSSDIGVILDLRSKLANLGVDLDAKSLASIAHDAACNDTAIALWEELDEDQRPKDYYIDKSNQTSYPDKIEFLFNSPLDDMYKRIMVAYRKNKQIELNVIQRTIVGLAIIQTADPKNKKSKSEIEEMRYVFPSLLTVAEMEKQSNDYLFIAAESYGIKPKNAELLRALNLLRYSNSINIGALSQLRFADPSAQREVNALLFIDKIQNTDFVKRTIGKNQANAEKIKGLCKAIRKYSQCVLFPIIVIEVGKVLEARGFFQECILYYEQVRCLSDSGSYQYMIDTRRLYNIDRYAESIKDKQMKAAANSLREELGYEDSDLSDLRDVTWDHNMLEEVYNDILDVNGDLLQEDSQDIDESEDKEEDEEVSLESLFDSVESNDSQLVLPFEDEIEQSTMQISSEDEIEVLSEDNTDLVDADEVVPDDTEDNVIHNNYAKPDPNASTQKFVILGYEISWIPKKEELHISYNHEDTIASLKIAKGQVRPFGLEVSEDGNLFFEETESPTPFVLSIEPGCIVLEVNDNNGYATGMHFSFVTNVNNN